MTRSIDARGRARLRVVGALGATAALLAAVLAPSAAAAPVTYRYEITIRGTGSADLASPAASNTYTSESGQASGSFTVLYTIDFTVDQAAQTVAVESLNPGDQAGTITATRLSGVDSYSRTTTCVAGSNCNTPPVTCSFANVQISPGYLTADNVFLEPTWGLGASHAAYAAGTAAFVELAGGGPGPGPGFPCSNPAAGSVSPGAATLPGLTAPTCGSEAPGYTLDIPIDRLGQRQFSLAESGSGASDQNCAIGTSEQASYTITALLAPQAVIVGVVTNRNGKPMPGVVVEAVRRGPKPRPSFLAVTASNGGYQITVKPGYWVVGPTQKPRPGGRWESRGCPGGTVFGRQCVLAVAAGGKGRYDFAYIEPDLVAEAIEPTQAIQSLAWTAPGSTRVPGPGERVTAADYTGVPLVEDVDTVVRLYAYVAPGDGAEPVRDVPAELAGYRTVNGRFVPLPGSPLTPMNYDLVSSKETLLVGPRLPHDRTSLYHVYTFDLPPAWAHAGTLTLVGEVDPPAQGTRPIADCCPQDSTVALTGIPFHTIRPIVVTPVKVVYRRLLPTRRKLNEAGR